MEIRTMTADDILEVSHLYVQSWQYAYRNIIPQGYLDQISSTDWSQNICSDGRINLIMIEDHKIIGTSCICRSRWDKYESYGEIVSIYFLPSYMGRGYGRIFMDHILENVRLLGFSDVLLWVLEENKTARKFYEKYGFQKSSESQCNCIGGKALKEVMYKYHII